MSQTEALWSAKDSADLKEFVSAWQELKPHLEMIVLKTQLAEKQAEVDRLRRA
jgi:hypothetical protein